MMLQQSFDYDTARQSSLDNSSYAQYMNVTLAPGKSDSRRGHSSVAGTSGKQWTLVTTRAQTSTGQSYSALNRKPTKSGLTHRSIGSAMAMRMSARVPYGSNLESVPSQLETKQFTRIPVNSIYNSTR